MNSKDLTGAIISLKEDVCAKASISQASYLVVSILIQSGKTYACANVIKSNGEVTFVLLEHDFDKDEVFELTLPPRTF